LHDTVVRSGFGTFLSRLHRSTVVVFGYLSCIVLGRMLLSLPPAQRDAGVGALDGFFIATSAVSTRPRAAGADLAV